MRSVLFSVSVDEDNDYIGEFDLEIPFEDEMYDRMVAVAQQCSEDGVEFTEELFDERLQDVRLYINQYADQSIPEFVEVEDEDDLASFMAFVQFPDDLCDVLLED